MNTDVLRDNYNLIEQALNDDVRPILAGFIGQALSKYYRADWWKKGVLEVLTPEQRRGLPREGSYEMFTDAMDVQLCRMIINQKDNWRNVFQQRLTDNQRVWLNEIAVIRNDWAHNKIKKFTVEYTVRALDTMIWLCDTLDKETAKKLRAQLEKLKPKDKPIVAYFDDDDDDDEEEEEFLQPTGDDVSWREVMQPNKDVQDGSFKKSEFAADLGAVAAGNSPMEEYQDATKFFARTYMTSGMRRLLTEALYRLVRGDGEPLIEVKTSFGGGKTHSMMALYHLFNQKYNPSKIDKSVQELLLDVQISALPKDIHIAVAVGVKVNTERVKDIPELEGVKAHTLMGEIFSQLARSAGRFDLYQRHIQLNDERGVSPGVDDLCAFLDGCGACLILLDELVLYGKKLYRGEGADRNKFDQFIAFLQELTEAIRMSKRSMLVASLPQSESEVGIGDGGQEVLRAIEHHFGRLQSVWSPVEAQESFEIVRRRLFQPCRQEKMRDEICQTYAAMYKRDTKKPNVFPISTREARYLNRLKACYPLHPQIFDVLYEKWATIEGFQRTRGVLRLVAEVVHQLWRSGDKQSMIMTGSIPLFDSSVREEVVHYIMSTGNWSAIINSEVDGENSEPRKLEVSEKRVQLQLARRLTRTIFMGSAPSTRGQNVRGLNCQEIMLGVLTPQDRREFSKFRDTLGKLKTKLMFMYSDEMYYWFDGRPTLRKLAEELAQGVTDEDIYYDIVDGLKAKMKRGKWFHAVHITAKPERIPDVSNVQLVILPPELALEGRSDFASKVYEAAESILNWSRNENPRLNKNMLIFLAGDKEGLKSLSDLIRQYRAWERLSNEREDRNLDQKQIAEVEKNIAELESKTATQLSASYTHLLEPTVRASDMKSIEWRETTLNCMGVDNIEVIGEQLRSRESLLLSLSEEMLAAELDQYIFKKTPRITLNRLWEYMAQYIYAPRLYDRNVLLNAVVEGVSKGLFGLAEAFDEETGEYTDLMINKLINIGSMDQLLVEREEAETHLHVEKPIVEEAPTVDEVSTIEPAPYVEPDPKRFAAAFDLNVDNPSRDVNRIMNEIADIWKCLDGAEIKLSLAIDGRAPDGIPEPECEALKQNCKMLKAKSCRFD